MAVDSREKRASALSTFSWDVVLPLPDGDTDNAEDRLHILGLYRGIAAAAPEAAEPVEFFTPNGNRPRTFRGTKRGEKGSVFTPRNQRRLFRPGK